MADLREAAQQALEALVKEAFYDGYTSRRTYNDSDVTCPKDEWEMTRSSYETRIAEHCAALSQQAEPVQAAIPLENSREAALAIEAVMAEYGHPTNPQNAARAGWRAARTYTAPQQAEPFAPNTGCKTPGECRKENFCMDGWHCASHAHGIKEEK